MTEDELAGQVDTALSPTCPQWCQSPAGHGFDGEGFSRVHAAILGTGEPAVGVAAMGRLTQDGEQLEDVTVNIGVHQRLFDGLEFPDELEMDAAAARALAERLVDAAGVIAGMSTRTIGAAAPTETPRASTEELLAEWEVYGRASGWSDSTVLQRRQVLNQLARHLTTPLEDASALEFAAWLAPARTASTRATYWRHTHSFYSWLRRAGHRVDDPTEAVKRPRQRPGAPRPATDEQVMAILEADLPADVRAFVVLAAYAGLRVHEIAKMRGEDVDVAVGSLRVVGKGGLEAVLPLHPKIAEVAQAYPDRGYWFPGGSGRDHLRAANVSLRIGRTFRELGHQVTAHQLRHWFGTNVLKSSGGNLRVAQELLRHASPATTAVYTGLDDAQRSAAIRGL